MELGGIDVARVRLQSSQTSGWCGMRLLQRDSDIHFSPLSLRKNGIVSWPAIRSVKIDVTDSDTL